VLDPTQVGAWKRRDESERLMLKARMAKEVTVRLENEIGALDDIARAVADRGVNVLAVCAWVEGAHAVIRLLTDDSVRVLDVLRGRSYEAREMDVLVTDAPYRWGNQDFYAADRIPYVGPILPGAAHVRVATGFNAWGITTGTAAAMMLADDVLGRQNPWSWLYNSRRLGLRGGGAAIAGRGLVAPACRAHRRADADATPLVGPPAPSGASSAGWERLQPRFFDRSGRGQESRRLCLWKRPLLRGVTRG
jgi:hypothetical protein